MVVAGVLVRVMFRRTNMRDEYAADDFASGYQPFTRELLEACLAREEAPTGWEDRAMRWVFPAHPTWEQRYRRQDPSRSSGIAPRLAASASVAPGIRGWGAVIAPHPPCAGVTSRAKGP